MIEFRILGPLEVSDRDGLLPLGGPKQRAVLAALLLRPGEVVSVERLVDEVWGDQPPESAGHSLEAYVSRIRGLLGTRGPSLARRGGGYALDLGDGTLDAQVFAELSAETLRAGADHARASELARAALALWRGPALADVTLGPTARTEAERLEEARLATLEQRFEAELALGQGEQAVGELQALATQHPYRERFVAQLMIALYHCGRHADALDAYEKLRARLAADLGLQPSEELQQLSGRIVRQEPELARPVRVHRQQSISPRPRLLALAAGTGLAVALAFTVGGSAVQRASGAPTPSPTRVALVLPDEPDGANHLMTLYRNTVGYVTEGGSWRLTRRVIVARDASPGTVGTVTSELRAGGFGLVLWIGDGEAARAMAPLARTMSSTKFVYVDASLARLSLRGVKNVSAIRFAEEETSDLVGYLSGLVPPRRRPPNERTAVVSFIGTVPTPQSLLDLASFRRGLHAAQPGARLLVDYAGDTENPTPCERIANSHIDRGAEVVFAVAGRCGTGALAVARARGVWATGSEESIANSRPADLLTRPYKEHDWGIRHAVERFLRGKLPSGGEVVLGLADDYAVGLIDTNYEIPSAAVSKTILRCSVIRQHTERHAE